MEYKETYKNSGGLQAKVTTGVSFFGIAGATWFGEVKTMWSHGTGEVQGEATAYSASASGTMTIKPAADGGVGNCSFIEVGGRGSEGCTGFLSGLCACTRPPACLVPPPSWWMPA